MENYTEQLKEIISNRTGIEKTEIHKDSFFEDDLNIGELELIEILEEIEETFEIDLVEEKDDIHTFTDLTHAVSDKIE